MEARNKERRRGVLGREIRNKERRRGAVGRGKGATREGWQGRREEAEGWMEGVRRPAEDFA